jgi:S1-C subfamily serine protease
MHLAFAEGGEAEAEVLGNDPDTDLALYRVALQHASPREGLGFFSAHLCRKLTPR